MDRFVEFTVLLGLILVNPAYCVSQVAKPTSDEEALIALVQLGRFSDHGIAANSHQEPVDQIVKSNVDPEDEISDPQEFLELLELRESNLSQNTSEFLLPWFDKVKNHSPKLAIDRFRKHGLIVTVHASNCSDGAG